MKLGYLFVIMLAGSSSGISAGISLIMEHNSIGMMGIVFGTLGVGSYFALLLLAGQLFDVDVKMEKS